MSLKAVHICFILLSIALAFGFGYWGVKNNFLYLGPGSLMGGIALVIYLFRFIQKMKKINPLPAFLFSALLGSPKVLFACSVCFGDPDSTLTKSVIAGVLVLLGVVGFVLSGIATLIFVWVRRVRKMAKLTHLLDSPAPMN